MRINREELETILEAQSNLDRAIFKKAGIETGDYPLENVAIAFYVELAELSQEWKGFKYWKENKETVNKEALLEEYADCLHFACSLTNYYLKTTPGAGRLLDAFLSVLDGEIKENQKYVKTRILKLFEVSRYLDKGLMILIDTLNLGAELGFTWEEIYKGYFRKNEINWRRIATGY